MKSKSSMETKKKMEGGDTMAEKTKLTQEQIDALIQKGKENKGVLTYRDVMSFINRMDDYIYGLPDGHEYKTLFLLMDGYKSYIQEGTDSVEHVLCNNGSPEAKTLLGIITIDKGDTISGMNMVKDAAEQGCSLAELLLTIPDWKGRLRADATKLGIIAHRVPLAYLILGDLYYEPDDNGKSNKQLAVEYYMKAEEHAVLGRHGAERVLDYYRNGGNVQLTEDDIKRLELIVQPKGVETE